MPLIPCICGPLHILPLRLRCRFWCLFKKNDAGTNLTITNRACGTTYSNGREFRDNATPEQLQTAVTALEKANCQCC